MCRRLQIAAIAWSVMWSFPHCSEGASPRLARFVPGAIPAGATVEVTLDGERIENPVALHFYEKGIRALDFTVDDGKVRATLQVDTGCRIGEHIGHLQTRSGITEYRPLYVVPIQTNKEVDGNDVRDSAQHISLNQAICGCLNEGDRDFYTVDVPRDTVLNIELIAMRLGNVPLDTIVTLSDEAGNKLESTTGHSFSINDPIMSYEVADAGRYCIEVRELLGAGNDQSHYVLCVGSHPRPLALFPPGGPLGEKIKIECRGDVRGPYTFTTVTPERPSRHHRYAPSRDGLRPPTPIPFRLSQHANLLEQEPNNAMGEANDAQISHAFCGAIEGDGDQDWFRFDAKKGQTIDIEVFARRVRSPLDSHLAIYDKQGKLLKGNDDGGKVTDHMDAEERGADSYLRFTPPDTDSYYLQVRDVLGAGSPLHVYRIECEAAKPWMLVRLPRVQDPNELYGQYRQQIFVARGNRFAALARARTRDFSGRMVLEIPALPSGVTYETQSIPAGTTGFPIVFTAAEDAPLGGGLYEMRGRHEDADKKIAGSYYNFADLLRAKVNNTLLKTRIAERVPIVVTDSLPFRIDGESPETPIVRSGIWKLKVRVVRDEGFDDPIRLTMPFLPPGIATTSGEIIPAGKTEAVFRLTAHPKMTPRDWKIYVQGVTGEENDWMWASTELIPLKVEKGYARLSLGPGGGSSGGAAQIHCDIEPLSEFDGEATIALSGLPEGVKAEPISFTHGQTSVAIPLVIAESSTPGRYQGIRATLTVPFGDAAVVSEFGPTVLTVTEAKTQGEQSPAVADAEADTTVKPLSRLERLRADAKARRSGEEVR